MKNKIPNLNKFLAVIITLIFSIALLISFLSFPIELVLLNYQNYLPVLEKEENIPVFTEIVSEILTSQISSQNSSNQIPSILSNQDNLKTVFNKYIPSSWAIFVFEDITNHVIKYLNFQIPESSMGINTSALKAALVLKSDSIAQDYILSLPRCSTAINENFNANSKDLDVYQLPSCKPSDNVLPAFINPTAIYLGDFINRLPASVSFNAALPFEKQTIERYFYFYTIARWGLRLLPLIAIGLLIAIALLLRREKYVMLRWIGILLLSITGLGLLCLMILLIGFNQFLVILVNRYLGNLVEGFGGILLQVMQKVGLETLVWIIISAAIVFVFGLFLIIVSRIIKTKTVTPPSSGESKGVSQVKETISGNKEDEKKNNKVIQPETLEETEAKENSNKI
jgi:hypothetical protein